MDTRLAISNSIPPIALSASYNSDNSFFAVGLDTGFRIYRSGTCELEKQRDVGGIGVAEMLETSQYIALASGMIFVDAPPGLAAYTPYKIAIWDQKQEAVRFTIDCAAPPLDVKLSKSHMVVIYPKSVQLFKFSSPPQELSWYNSAENPRGLCCLRKKLFVFPGRKDGQVHLVELATRSVNIIPAHTTPLQALELSLDGEILATASQQGTIIRVWSTANNSRIAELRRGIDSAAIYSLAISPSSTLLAVTSDKSTLHIFDLPHAARTQNHQSGAPTNTSTRDITQDDSDQKPKWGILSKLPGNHFFKDTYSFTSAHFEIGEDSLLRAPKHPHANAKLNWFHSLGPRIPKGIIGWLDENSLIVIGAGQDAIWERFVIGVADDGSRVCYRAGWRKFLE